MGLTTKYTPQTTPNSAVAVALYFRSTNEKIQIKNWQWRLYSEIPIFETFAKGSEIGFKSQVRVVEKLGVRIHWLTEKREATFSSSKRGVGGGGVGSKMSKVWEIGIPLYVCTYVWIYESGLKSYPAQRFSLQRPSKWTIWKWKECLFFSSTLLSSFSRSSLHFCVCFYRLEWFQDL